MVAVWLRGHGANALLHSTGFRRCQCDISPIAHNYAINNVQFKATPTSCKIFTLMNPAYVWHAICNKNRSLFFPKISLFVLHM